MKQTLKSSASTSLKKELAKQRSKKTIHEPSISPLKYRDDMLMASNWYNQKCEPHEFKTYFREHFQERIDFPMDEISNQEYRISGMLTRIQNNGNQLEDQHIEKIESEFIRIQILAKSKKIKVSEEEVKPKSTAQSRMEEKVSNFMAEFNGLVDEFTLSGKMPNTTLLLKSVGITGQMLNKVSEKIKPTISELQEVLAGTDHQLVEGYSNFKRPEIKRLLLIYTNLLDSLVQVKEDNPKKVKESKKVPLSVQTKNVKYKIEDPGLGIKSIDVTDLIGCKELWVYDTQHNQLVNYVALDDTGIAVKGTTLFNFDPAASGKRRVKKPETVASLNGQGKRGYAAFVKNLLTKEHEPSGRLNDHSILMAALR